MLTIPWTSKPPAGTPIDRSNPLSRGIVFDAPFNEHGGPPVDGVSRMQSTVLGGAAWRDSDSIYHDGTDDEVRFNNIYDTNFLGAITVMVIAYQGGNANYRCLASKCQGNGGGTVGNRGPFDIYTDSNGYIRFNRAGAAGAFCYSTASSIVGATKPYEKATYIFTAPDNSIDSHASWGIYVNGKNVWGNSTRTGVSSLVSSADYPISTIRADGGTKFQGFTHLIRVWNRVLSLSEIQEITKNPWQIYQPVTIPIGAGASQQQVAQFLGSIRSRLLTGISRGRISCGY